MAMEAVGKDDCPEAWPPSSPGPGEAKVQSPWPRLQTSPWSPKTVSDFQQIGDTAFLDALASLAPQVVAV